MSETTDLGPGRLRQVMGRFATGVCVVTTLTGGHDHAMTADTLTSVSLDPLLVLVCVQRDSRFHDAVLDARVFGASILGAEQRAVSDWLATPGRPLHGQLDRVPHQHGPLTGVALIDGSLGMLECRVRDIHPAGDHSIVVGEVVGLWLPDDTSAALVHYRGGYGSLD
jgi:flavin reductase (DIM6/NTAB) family NADH-FMN oxidoreductase RutF